MTHAEFGSRLGFMGHGVSMFRRFYAEAEDVLGSYDGRAIMIARRATTSLEVAVHEGIHERIFHETLDGTFHRLLIDTVDNKPDAMSAKRSHYLLRETEYAHEAAATYIGVQALDAMDERAQTFADLPADYQTYYKVLGDVITPLTASTYLAFTLGWSLAYWAFQSERLFEIFREGWSSFESIVARVPSPTERLSVGVEFLQSSGVSWLDSGLKVASAAYSEAATPPWDVHDDEQWRAQPLSTIAQFEAHLSGALWRLLRDDVPITTACPENRPDGFDRWLLDRLEVPDEQTGLIVRNDAFNADPDSDLILTTTAAIRAGRAKISNSDVVPIERVRSKQAVDLRRAIARVEKHSPAVYCVGTAAPDSTMNWAIYVYKLAGRASSLSMGSALADRFLVAEGFAIELLSRLNTAGPPKPRNGSLFMAPANMALRPYASDILSPLIEGVPSGGAQSTLRRGYDYPLWYWTGDWTDLLREPELATGAIRLEPSGTGLQESYLLLLARKPDLPGYAFRLVSPLPANAILRYDEALKIRGAIGTIPDDEVERALVSITGYIGIIFDNWDVF